MCQKVVIHTYLLASMLEIRRSGYILLLPFISQRKSLLRSYSTS